MKYLLWILLGVGLLIGIILLINYNKKNSELKDVANSDNLGHAWQSGGHAVNYGQPYGSAGRN